MLLGQLYQEGILVPKDPTLAKTYFDAAPAQLAKEEESHKEKLQAKGEWDAHMAQMDAEHHRAMLGIWSNGLSNIAGALAGAPPTTAASSVSAADTSSGSSAAAKGHYTGVNAQYVDMMLSRSVNWSCSPYRAPAKPTRITCQRDGFVYQAQQTAVASECSAQTGHPEDAVTDANLTLSALKSAGQLCGAQAPTGAVRCDTDALISCAQLPR
jgi:hypothetical protein